MASGNTNAVSQILEAADIVQVCVALGLPLDRAAGSPRKALCPFHQDKTPSMNLYPARGASRAHYHCFACGAHGSAVDLVMNVRKLEFKEAVEWLSELVGIRIEKRNAASIRGADAVAGRQSLQTYLKQELAKKDNQAKSMAVATHRGFDNDFLAQREIGVLRLDALITEARKDPVLAQSLVVAGIARRPEMSPAQPEIWPGDGGLRPFYSGERLLMSIKDHRGDIAGYAARSLQATDKFKYLYSHNFKRSQTLYGADRVLAHLRSSPIFKTVVFDLYIVEGIFDALRLETFGLSAVAILGSSLSQGQLHVLQAIRKACETENSVLQIHLFLDGDQAGAKAAYDALRNCMRLSVDGGPISVDVIRPIVVPGDTEQATKIDPDTFLRGAKDRGEAFRLLKNATVNGLQFLLDYELSLYQKGQTLNESTALIRATIARKLAITFQDIGWRAAAFCLTINNEPSAELASFETLIEGYANSRSGPATLKAGGEKQSLYLDVVDRPDNRATLLRALTLARSSTARREYPIDDSAWERLSAAASSFFHLHSARLQAGDRPASPYLARHVPKDDNKNRLKAGPIPEDALIQQYMLLELLRVRPESPGFQQSIPAVRYWGDVDSEKSVETTGTKHSATVSFAYQVDMRVVNGLIPPQREGLFRSYFDCWRTFIEYIDKSMRRMPHEVVQIVRLDVAGFYDNIPSYVVQNALRDPLEKALLQLPVDRGMNEFAPLFRSDKVEQPRERSDNVLDFLLKHSFGFKYYDPLTGEERTTAKKDVGIPQGPDLSAYLANVSLFSLDEIMIEAIDELNREISDTSTRKNPVGAVYARYVDDIILVCQNHETATRLQRLIENHLAKLGLKLNRKNQPIEPMLLSDARLWLTDNRTSFGFSGPLSELPMIDAMDPLGDAGEIDRKTALGLIHDPSLDIPTQNSSSQLEQVQKALASPELRFNDLTSAFRKFWLYATGEDGSEAHPDKRFGQLVAGVEALDLLDDEHRKKRRTKTAIAAYEALERFLRFGAQPPQTFSDGEAMELRLRAQKLAKSVLHGMLLTLPRELGLSVPDSQTFFSKSDIQAQCLIIIRLALEATQVFDVDLQKCLPAAALTSPAHRILRLPLKRYLNLAAEDFRTVAPQTDESMNAIEAVHESIVLLQRYLHERPTSGASLQDPLESVKARFTRITSESTRDITQRAFRIIRVWSTDDPKLSVPIYENADSEIELDAASTFVSVAHRYFAELAQNRSALLALLSHCKNAQPLPNPPGLYFPGIMLWCDDAELRCTIVRSSDPNVVESDLLPYPADQWEKEDLETPSNIAVYKAKTSYLGKAKPLALDEGGYLQFDNPADIATLYRSLYRDCDPSVVLPPITSGGDPRMLVHTAYSFFGDERSYKIYAWAVPRNEVASHAFVRGGAGLEERAVYLDGDSHWRFGWAFRDIIGYLDGVGDDELGVDSTADVDLSTVDLRRRALMIHVLPKLSGRDAFGVGDSAEQNTPPSRISRWLNLLESFSADNEPVRDSLLLAAAFAEGVFMNERVSWQGALDWPGVSATLLMNSTFRASRSFRRFAQSLPDIDSEDLPYRRTSRAWLALASKLVVSDGTLPAGAQLSLSAMVEGCQIYGATSAMRALALEIATNFESSDLAILKDLRIESDWLDRFFGQHALLINIPAASQPETIEGQVARLLKEFGKIASNSKSSTLKGYADSITPLGWALMLGVLLGLLPIQSDLNHLRLRLRHSNEPGKAIEVLEKLIAWLGKSISESETTQDDWPWDLYKCYDITKPDLQSNRIRDLAKLLISLDKYANIQIVEHFGTAPPLGHFDKKTRTRQVVLPDGSRRWLKPAQIDLGRLNGDRVLELEHYVSNGSSTYRWSSAFDGDRLVGLHAVTVECARASFGYLPDKSKNNTEKTAQSNSQPAKLQDFFATESTSLEKSATNDSSSEAYTDGGTKSEQLQNVWKKQLKFWETRKKSNKACFRVAMIQWDVSETYHEPSKADEELLIGADSQAAVISITEYRRRQLLSRLLDVCDAFEVDGLIFPEYALRPETINWLSRQLHASRKLPKAIWAGTFRVPVGAAVAVDNTSKIDGFIKVDPSNPKDAYLHHSSILSCLYWDEKWKLRARAKRFPSVAAKELIRPPHTQAWFPLLRDISDPRELGAYAIELVCSEMFVHASSANFPGIIEATNDLNNRYWSLKNHDALDWITADVHAFAQRTSRLGELISLDTLERSGNPRRSLIVLPAMTGRTADYHIFGQNQYLAAGLVTAFCNAVSTSNGQKLGQGHSCFIGLHAWDNTKVHEPPPNPYCGVAPGIFQVGSNVAGPLETGEQAMIIADLDLENTTEYKPRPHFANHPLVLVAHLPIIFATDKRPGGLPGVPDAESKTRFIRHRLIPIVAGGAYVPQTFADQITLMETALEQFEKAKKADDNHGKIPVAFSDAVRDWLSVLEIFADDGKWLKRRSQSFKAATTEPLGMTPPPTLLDWIWVDDSWTNRPASLRQPRPLGDSYKEDLPCLEIETDIIVS